MKKMFLLAAATVITTVSFSQVRFGAQVIGNAGSASVQSEDIPDFKKSMQVGFGAGVVTEMTLQNNFSLRSSLNFLQKKSSFEFSAGVSDNRKSTVKTSLNYLELPVNLVYSIPVNGMNVYFGAGPSFGYGISGKIKYDGYLATEDGGVVPVNATTEAFKKGDDGAAMKRFDLSANVNAGLQFKNGLYVNAGYLAGVSNIANGDGKYKNRGILLTVGFLLPSKK